MKPISAKFSAGAAALFRISSANRTKWRLVRIELNETPITVESSSGDRRESGPTHLELLRLLRSSTAIAPHPPSVLRQLLRGRGRPYTRPTLRDGARTPSANSGGPGNRTLNSRRLELATLRATFSGAQEAPRQAWRPLSVLRFEKLFVFLNGFPPLCFSLCLSLLSAQKSADYLLFRPSSTVRLQRPTVRMTVT